MVKNKKNIRICLRKDFKKNRALYIMSLPAIVIAVLFMYIPMYGVLMAFFDYRSGNIFSNTFVGLKYFRQFFEYYQFAQILFNTVILSFLLLLIAFPIPVVFALFLNQMSGGRIKKSVQTITYIPHFISSTVVVGMILVFLNPTTGLYANICHALNLDTVNLMADPKMFRVIYVISEIWQHTGWDAIIYIAALTSVDMELYDAARVDGAGKLQRIRYIDLPAIMPTILTMLILRVGNMFNIGFDKVYLLQNSLNISTAEIIPTYIYRTGILQGNISYSTTVGLFNSFINLVLLLIVNQICRKIFKTSIW